jgi:DNA-binding NarL/FixJ family response regulator
MTIRVLVADDHQVVRTGLARLLKDSEIEIVAEAVNGPEAVARTMEVNPDVVLMDIRMPEGDGLAALESIRKEKPDIGIVMLSTYDNPTYVARSVALGATDYVLKDSSREELISAITRAATGESPSKDSILHHVKDTMSRRRERLDRSEIPLTNRELQVLRHVALGLSNREIGQSLGISVETVKEHVQNILRKIDASDRTQAAVWAIKKGLA